MKAVWAALAAAMVFGAAALAQAPSAAPASGVPVAADKMAMALLPAKAKLTVSTPAFKDGADMPIDNTQYGKNLFPGLRWSKGPGATKSYAVIMQDEDALRNGDAILHWTMYNVPANVTTLDPGMTAPPAGASFGPSIGGQSQPYRGPRTPAGPKHHYPLQVFALDMTLPADPAMTFDALKTAMAGHVLASGQVVGMGMFFATAAPASAPSASPPPAAH